jgi:hypothetical protein
MQAEAIEQIRARVQYQKELMEIKGHSTEEEIAEMYRWINVTFFVGFPIVLASLAYSFLFEEHRHRIEGDLPEYMKIRNKEFPWSCGDCDLFDGPCWAKCKAEKEAKKQSA